MTELLAPEAVPAWLAERGLDASAAVPDGDVLRLGDRGTVTRGWPGPPRADELEQWLAAPPRLALLLLRRGGYAVGLAEGSRLVAHKCGTRYVQSRTAAGGWSQQRFQRRRENQAAGLVDGALGHLARLLTEHTGQPASGAAERWVDGVVLGGDRLLLQEATTLPPMPNLAGLPSRTFADIPDPDLKVLRRTLWRARAVEATLTEEPAG